VAGNILLLFFCFVLFSFCLRNDPYTHFSQQPYNKLTWLVIFYYFFCFLFVKNNKILPVRNECRDHFSLGYACGNRNPIQVEKKLMQVCRHMEWDLSHGSHPMCLQRKMINLQQHHNTPSYGGGPYILGLTPM
jgi:hypothetical protein